MNKLLWILAILAIGLFALAACGDSDGSSGGPATSTKVPLPTDTPLPPGASEAQRIALKLSELPEGWVELGGVEITVEEAGASGWAMDFSNSASNETLNSKTFLYATKAEVAGPFDVKSEEFSSLTGFTSLGNMGFSAFYALDETDSTHIVWVRRKNAIFSVELVTDQTTGKSETIVLAKILDDRLALGVLQQQ